MAILTAYDIKHVLNGTGRFEEESSFFVPEGVYSYVERAKTAVLTEYALSFSVINFTSGYQNPKFKSAVDIFYEFYRK